MKSKKKPPRLLFIGLFSLGLGIGMMLWDMIGEYSFSYGWWTIMMFCLSASFQVGSFLWERKVKKELVTCFLCKGTCREKHAIKYGTGYICPKCDK